ncbi:MAG TPA: MFS transporter [Pseudonocardiaceae bacterium]|nr:MFS transporter [Pseudonocardiaceae bacterium]
MTAVVDTRMRAARWALTVVFAADGMVFATWSSRLPQVQHAVHADNSMLGIALLGTAIGALIAMPTIGRVCRHIRPRVVALTALGALAGSMLLPGLAGSPVSLLVVLLAFGAAYGSVDVSMNSAAVDLGEEINRPILPTFHSAYSLGGLVGAGAGSLAAAGSVPVELHFAVVAAVTVGCLLVALRPLSAWPERVSARHGDDRPARRSMTVRQALPILLVAAVLTFGSAFGESTTANWAGIHLTQQAHAAASLAPLAFGAFSLAQAVVRAGGARLTERFGPRRVVAAGALLASCGFAVTLTPAVLPALFGYLVVGIGLSCIFPLGTAYAGETAGSVGVSVSSSVGYAGVLLGPPLVGLLAGVTSLTTALTVPLILALIILAVATRLPGTATRPADEPG